MKQNVIDELGVDFKLPKHVGIIMDGNGRWAKSHGKMRITGHRAGMERLHGIVAVSSDIGLEALTLYAFSTENWARPTDEVNALMGLLIEYFNKEIDELDANGVCIRHLGTLDGFPVNVAEAITNAVEHTKFNTGLNLNLALNYGSRAEIARATRLLALQVQQGLINVSDIDETAISNTLYTKALPDPDVIIRTSGEMRLSNFLLYQSAYSEFVFVSEHWPDFSDTRYIAALREYSQRARRYGGV